MTTAAVLSAVRYPKMSLPLLLLYWVEAELEDWAAAAAVAVAAAAAVLCREVDLGRDLDLDLCDLCEYLDAGLLPPLLFLWLLLYSEA